MSKVVHHDGKNQKVSVEKDVTIIREIHQEILVMAPRVSKYVIDIYGIFNFLEIFHHVIMIE